MIPALVPARIGDHQRIGIAHQRRDLGELLALGFMISPDGPRVLHPAAPSPGEIPEAERCDLARPEGWLHRGLAPPRVAALAFGSGRTRSRRAFARPADCLLAKSIPPIDAPVPSLSQASASACQHCVSHGPLEPCRCRRQSAVFSAQNWARVWVIGRLFPLRRRLSGTPRVGHHIEGRRGFFGPDEARAREFKLTGQNLVNSIPQIDIADDVSVRAFRLEIGISHFDYSHVHLSNMGRELSKYNDSRMIFRSGSRPDLIMLGLMGEDDEDLVMPRARAGGV